MIIDNLTIIGILVTVGVAVALSLLVSKGNPEVAIKGRHRLHHL